MSEIKRSPMSSDKFPQVPPILPPTATILGVKVHALTNPQTLELIESLLPVVIPTN